MDALKIMQAVLGGYDWGASLANIVSALWPERVKALVSVSVYLIEAPVGHCVDPVGQGVTRGEGTSRVAIPGSSDTC